MPEARSNALELGYTILSVSCWTMKSCFLKVIRIVNFWEIQFAVEQILWLVSTSSASSQKSSAVC